MNSVIWSREQNKGKTGVFLNRLQVIHSGPLLQKIFGIRSLDMFFDISNVLYTTGCLKENPPCHKDICVHLF